MFKNNRRSIAGMPAICGKEVLYIMKRNIYPRLAWTGIRKNGRLYLPYIMTCSGMVMMYYIISFLSSSEYLGSCRGGDIIQGMLTLGCGVIGFFAAILLFYTNSFLMRRRKKEFGLYNILGMGKWNIAHVLLWETLMIAGLAIGAGSIGGILFSKFAELCIINILKAETRFAMTIETGSLWNTAVLFGIIFILILLNALRQLHFANPIELLHSENTGEKPPRANWIFAAAGAVLLAGAYYLAVMLENPIEVMVIFFIAVIMVIAATYLLFISGSVTICRSLQKNKRYYYRTNHFVSVSSMIYRMRRNGAGLASICILCTMVLVMVSSTVCLYIGAEDSLRARYPRHVNITARGARDAEALSGAESEKVRELAGKVLAQYSRTAGNVLDYRIAGMIAYEQDGVFRVDDPDKYVLQGNFRNVWQIYIVPLEDYNRLAGEKEELTGREVLIYSNKKAYKNDFVSIAGTEPFSVKRTVEHFVENGEDAAQVLPSLYLIMADFEEMIRVFAEPGNFSDGWVFQLKWQYAFDLDAEDDEQIEISRVLKKQIEEYRSMTGAEAENGGERQDFSYVQLESVARGRTDFYALYGGLFFLGILLGIVFIFAAILIMYYKQISEGYEDQSRFEIMQKVGMTKREIRRSVNSQVITVFFLPLAAAGLHLAFAFPMIQKCMLLFGVTNGKLLVLVTLASFGLFALFYVLAYRITSHSYYAIVSGSGDRER